MPRAAPALLALAVLGGCGRAPPSQAQIDDAKGRVEAAVEAADQARTLLELLGILPTYDCGEPRRTFVGKAVEAARSQVGCLTAEAAAEGADADQVSLSYPDAGCEVKGRSLRGRSVFRYSGGEDRLDLEADFRETLFDGQPLQGKAGYGECSDEKRYWGAAQGKLPKRPHLSYKVDGRVATREGLPLIGSTTIVLDGPGEVTHPEGIDRLTFTGLEYELKQYLPKEGELLVETSSGHRVHARFTSTLWRLGQAEVTVDDHAPVKVPTVH